MYEEKVKKRGWIKNAVIVFLTIMLILTFFSNTIMNHSLPEISAQYVTSGTINAKIRGSGTVKANQDYEVVLQQTREIVQVNVKVGDTVAIGDLLFTLADTDSTELTDAQTTLENLELEYQKALINATNADYTKENRDIQRAREKLDKSIAERDACVFSATAYNEAKQRLQAAKDRKRGTEAEIADLNDDLNYYNSRLSDAQSDVSNYEQTIADLKEDISSYEAQIKAIDGAGTSDLDRQIKDIELELEDAQQTLAEDQQIHGAAYQQLREAAIAALPAEDQSDEAKIRVKMGVLVKTDATDEQKVAYKTLTVDQDAVDKLQLRLERAKEDLKNANSGSDGTTSRDDLVDKLNKAKKSLSTTESNLSSAKKRVRNYTNDVSDTQSSITKKQNALNERSDLVDECQQTVTDLENNKTEYENAVQEVETNETALEDLIFTLSETQKSDDVKERLENLDLQAQQRAIARQRKVVAKYQEESTATEVTANVAGTVSTINVKAGESNTAGEAMATITVEDRGFTVSIPATLEQSKRVAVGDVAEVSGAYWGSSIQATLAAIKNDPDNPGKGKLLEFNVTGDVEPNMNLSLTIGQKSQNYDSLVPRSAVRTDSNGDFVLVVIAKSSPLGNRYVATRTDVKVQATDDTMAAVSGLGNSDYVITTSSKPIEAGMQVRIADE